MPKRTPAKPSQPIRPSGPAPLRQREEPREPKGRPRASWRQILYTLRHPTIGTLRRDLSHVLLWGLVGFVIIFVAGIFMSFGDAALNFGRRTNEETAFPVIAQVGGRLQGRAVLTRAELEEQMRSVGMLRDEMMPYRLTQTGQMFDRWVDEQLIARVARQRGVKVTSADYEKEVKKRVDEALKAERGNLSERDWKYRLQQQGKSADAAVADARRKVTDSTKGLRAYLLQDKLRKHIEDEVKITDQDLRDKYEEITANIIVVKADQPKPPPAPKDQKESAEDAKRRGEQEAAWSKSLDAKKAKAEAVLAEVKAAPDQFAAIAKAKSDDYTAGQGAKIGPAARDNYDLTRFGDEFKKAVFELKNGEISALIKGDPGWVIAKVIGRKSWPDDFQKPEPRSFEEAQKVADDVAAQLQKGADFAKLAKEKSDDPGSKDKGGEYDMTGRNVWVKPFEKMAFALDVKELSKPFKTQFGIHIMQVLERELPEKGEVLPKDDEPAPGDDMKTAEERAAAEAELKALPLPEHKDLAKAKRVKVRHILIKAEDPKKKIEDKRKQLQNEKQSKHYEEFMKKTRDDAYKSGLVKVLSPDMRAYLAGKDNKTDEQIFWLRQAAATWQNSHGEVQFELAKQYERKGMGLPAATKVAAAKALPAYPSAEVVPDLVKALDTFEPDVRKAVANALGDLKAKEAVERLQQIVRIDADDSVAEAATEALKKIGAEVPKREKPSPLPTPGAVGAKP